ncbi:RrF2 family transcriptional regulator [Robiginitomaculum antarcticum]|uniref:RrF2 family transcriptional regulator n=1 Tax=Robiginitomaculum antarcticum TaxID=437507 RepID=UPI000475522D|nr:Rrf2 family transcriptional regulator [Robiginitomaculum antarcticum]
MKLTAKGRYAVMAVADLAKFGAGDPVSLSEISMRQGISLSFLEQIFGGLRRAGLVESSRGAQGGYALARPAATVTLDQIIAAVDEQVRAHGCDPTKRAGCTGGNAKCLTHDLWGALESHIGEFMSRISVADVVDGRAFALEAAQ